MGKGMAVGCGAKCAKAMLIVFNIIFWLSGCALLGVGIWLRVDKSILDIMQITNINDQDPVLDYAAYLLIAVGAFVFLVGFLGCCGAIKENKCCLGLYIFFLLIVMAAELAAGIFILVYKDELISTVTNELKTELEEDPYVSVGEDDKTEYTGIGATMNLVQQRFMCCGVEGADDYAGSNYTVNIKNMRDDAAKFEDFPFTCCKMKKDTDLLADPVMDNIADADKCIAKDEEFYYKDGCKDNLEAFIQQHTLIVIGIGIGIACLEVFGIIFAICLCRNVGELE